MRNVRARAIGAATLAAVMCAGILAACGNPAEQAAQNIVEQAVEGATGGDVDLSDDSMSVTDAEGNEFAVGGDITMPDNWPAEVPEYSGTLSMVSVQTDGTAYAMWMADTTAIEAADGYGQQLTSAGFALEQDSNMGGTIVREYRSDALTVSVIAGEADGTTTISVTAMPQ